MIFIWIINYKTNLRSAKHLDISDTICSDSSFSFYVWYLSEFER